MVSVVLNIRIWRSKEREQVSKHMCACTHISHKGCNAGYDIGAVCAPEVGSATRQRLTWLLCWDRGASSGAGVQWGDHFSSSEPHQRKEPKAAYFREATTDDQKDCHRLSAAGGNRVSNGVGGQVS